MNAQRNVHGLRHFPVSPDRVIFLETIMARVGVIAGVIQKITDRDIELLSDEEMEAIEELEHDPEILQEIIDLKPGSGGWPT